MAYNQASGNPYGSPQQSPGYGNPYGSPEQHEMQQYSSAQTHPQSPYGAPPPAHVLTQQDFLSRVSHVRNEIRSLTADVQRIGTLHQHVLDGNDDTAQRRLDDLVAQTQLKNTSIRDQIKSLKGDVERTTDGSAGMKKRQWEALSGDFKNELNNYMQEERQVRERYRQQIARQYKIVNPDATDEEVREATEMDWGNEGVFQTALRVNRSGQASAVLGNVRARHNELLSIEKSINEVTMLFEDLNTLVIQQEEPVKAAEHQTDNTIIHLQKGNEEVDKGIDHARRRRKLKWICALIVVLIILGLALGIGLGITLTNNAKKAATGS